MSSELPTTHEAIRELASSEDAAALTLLTEIAVGEDQFLRRTALEVIGSHPQVRLLHSIILNALSDPSGYVVRTACEIVAKREMAEAHDLVFPLLSSVSGSTRAAALRALCAIWRTADFPVVFRIYERDPDFRVRREAAWVLRKHTVSENWRTLFEAFSVDELPRHRQWACEIAETFSSVEMLPLLSQLTFDPNGHVRKAAARTIETISIHKG